MDPNKTGYSTAYGGYNNPGQQPQPPPYASVQQPAYGYSQPIGKYPAQYNPNQPGGAYSQPYPQPYPQPAPYPATAPSRQPESAPNVEVTMPENFSSGFDDKIIRLRFIRRVYFILTLQLSVTVGFICLFLLQEDVQKFVQKRYELYIAAYVIFIVTYISLVCCSNLRRKYPTNFILLCVFTLSLSYLVGMISSFHDTQIVLIAMGICTAVCLCVSIFAIQTKFDFTKLGGILFVIFLVVFIFGIFAIIMRHKIMTVVYSGLIALVFMGFLAYDTQLVIGGKHRKFELSPEEYITGALQLYMDIVQIFLAILSLTSSSSS